MFPTSPRSRRWAGSRRGRRSSSSASSKASTARSKCSSARRSTTSSARSNHPGRNERVLDLKLIRQEPDRVRAGAAKKRIACDVDRILALDKDARELGLVLDKL